MQLRTLITGCSTGIGRALALELTRRGHEVIATARRLEALSDLPVAHRLALDVTSEASISAAVAAAGHIDVLVNNAGVGIWGPVEATSLEDVQRVFDTNVYGPLRMMRAVLPQMRMRGSGAVLQVSSAAGRFTGPLVGIYAASKHALEAYSEAMRIELASFGVRMTIVEPGAVESAFPQNRTSAASGAYEEVVQHFTRRLMANRTAATSSELVAARIAAILEEPTPRLRYAVTADAELFIDARRKQSDEEWERQQLAN